MHVSASEAQAGTVSPTLAEIKIGKNLSSNTSIPIFLHHFFCYHEIRKSEKDIFIVSYQQKVYVLRKLLFEKNRATKILRIGTVRFSNGTWEKSKFRVSFRLLRIFLTMTPGAKKELSMKEKVMIYLFLLRQTVNGNLARGGIGDAAEQFAIWWFQFFEFAKKLLLLQMIMNWLFK